MQKKEVIKGLQALVDGDCSQEKKELLAELIAYVQSDEHPQNTLLWLDDAVKQLNGASCADIEQSSCQLEQFRTYLSDKKDKLRRDSKDVTFISGVGLSLVGLIFSGAAAEYGMSHTPMLIPFAALVDLSALVTVGYGVKQRVDAARADRVNEMIAPPIASLSFFSQPVEATTSASDGERHALLGNSCLG